MNMISINLPFFFKAFGKKILEPGKRKPSNFQAWSVTSHWDTKFWWSFGGKALWPGGRLCFRRKVSCSFFYLSIKRRFSYLYLDLWYLVWKLFLLFFFWMWSVVKVWRHAQLFGKVWRPSALTKGEGVRHLLDALVDHFQWSCKCLLQILSSNRCAVMHHHSLIALNNFRYIYTFHSLVHSEQTWGNRGPWCNPITRELRSKGGSNGWTLWRCDRHHFQAIQLGSRWYLGWES